MVAARLGGTRGSRTLSLGWLKVAKDDLLGFGPILEHLVWFCNPGVFR